MTVALKEFSRLSIFKMFKGAREHFVWDVNVDEGSMTCKAK